MIEFNFENFINEKMGIRDDVVILSDFLYDYLSDANKEKIIIINGENIPKVSFNISKIVINFVQPKYYMIASLDEKRSKLTRQGMEIYLFFNKDEKLSKSTINHELSHLIDHEIKLSKRIEDFRDATAASKISNLLNNRNFNNLCNLIYSSDDSEINSITHEFHDLLTNGYSKLKDTKSKNEIFDIYDKMIYYNIFEDLKDIPDKTKIKFFSDLINWNKKMIKIKKNRNSQFMIYLKIAFYLAHGYEKNIDLHGIMYKTQTHINSKGIRLRNNIHRLYGLLDN